MAKKTKKRKSKKYSLEALFKPANFHPKTGKDLRGQGYRITPSGEVIKSVRGKIIKLDG